MLALLILAALSFIPAPVVVASWEDLEFDLGFEEF
jgi:hypothetical protein